MASSKGIFSQIVSIVLNTLTAGTSRSRDGESGRSGALSESSGEQKADREQGSVTVQINPELLAPLRVRYAPEKDGAPDAGEVIWTWVPFEENDGRGKDRPVLVIGRAAAQRVYAVRMTSKPHDHDRDYLSIGSGSWDSQRRESWVDIEQLYSVHEDGMRREAAVLDRKRYDRVASALIARYRWAKED